MRLSFASTTLLIILTGWFSLNFVGVPRLVSAEPLVSLAGFNLGVMLALIFASLATVRFASLIGVCALGIWAALQIETHWWGYFNPVKTTRLDWYQSVWGANWRLLPDATEHTVPDGYHTILFGLIMCAAVSCLMDMVRRVSVKASG
jgi:hypothetical protein